MIQEESLDLSIVLNLHNEGQLALPTIESLLSGVGEAQRAGLSCEVIYCLDSPSSVTIKLVEEIRATTLVESKVLILDNRDLGLSRNDGCRHALGKYVVFCDGDDLYSRNWFRTAFEVAEESLQPENVVIHPDVALVFGEQFLLFYLPETADLVSADSTHQLLYDNPWVSGSLVARELCQRVPFRKTGIEYGYEDWSWFAELTALGVQHGVAPRTAHFVRRKPESESLLRKTDKQVLYPYFGDLLKRVAHAGESAKPSPFRIPRLKALIFRVLSLSGVATSIAKRIIRLTRTVRLSLQDPLTLSPSFLRLNDDVAVARNQGVRNPLKRFQIYVKTNRRVTTATEIGLGGVWPITELIAELSEKAPFPKWLAVLAAEQSMWEKELQPSEVAPPGYHNPFGTPGPRISAELLAQIDGCDSIILVPWLLDGGADFEVVELAIEAKRRGSCPIVLSSSGGCNLRWRRMLDENNIRFVHLQLSGFSAQIQGLAIHHLISASKCRWVHVMNSPAGWNYLKEIVANVRHEGSPAITVQLFCHDYDEFNSAGGYLTDFPTTHRKIDAVVTDNAYLEDLVESEYGISTVPFFQLHHPIKAVQAHDFADREQVLPPRIIWASRPVRQKNLSLAFEVFTNLDGQILDLWGAKVEDLQFGDLALLPSIKDRVRFHGRYVTFDEVHQGKGGVFFYTSLWDGLPNVVLEALGAGMHVVAPRLPGLVASIDESLIDYFDHGDSLHSIAEKIRHASSNAELGLNVNGIRFISENFSLANFQADLDTFFSSILQV